MTRTGWAFTPGVAVVYGAAGVGWLGTTMWGILSDCGPRHIDGQCGMSTAFAGFLGLGLAFVVVGGARVFAGIPRHYLSRDRRQFWIAWATAFLAGLVALNICVVVGFILERPHALSAAVESSLNYWPITVFLGAPFAYTLVFLVVAMSNARVRRTGRASAWWTCSVGAAGGALCGVVIGPHWAYSTVGRLWLTSGGGWTGAVVGLVFWCVALLGRMPVTMVADEELVHDTVKRVVATDKREM